MSTGTFVRRSSTAFTSGRIAPRTRNSSAAFAPSPAAWTFMISPVSARTASLIFAGSTEKVPSFATRTAPASSNAFSCRAMPTAWASPPKRSVRNDDARNVTYTDRSSARSRTPLSIRYCSAKRPAMSAFASSSAP